MSGFLNAHHEEKTMEGGEGDTIPRREDVIPEVGKII